MLRAGLGGGTGSNSTERMDDDQEPLLHALPLVGICGAICRVEIMEHAHNVVSRNDWLLPRRQFLLSACMMLDELRFAGSQQDCGVLPR